MFKKILMITALTLSHNAFTMSAMKAETVQTAIAASSSGTVQWLKHFGVARLVYHVIGAVERKVIDFAFPMNQPREESVDMNNPKDVADMKNILAMYDDEQIEIFQPKVKINGRNFAISMVATLATMYGCYKLTNHLHQKMSPESYRWAHLLGALF